jgi:fusaric acid resistance family protein
MPRQRLTRAQALTALRQAAVLAVACLVSYWLDVTLLSRVRSLPDDDDLLGGMWAVIATIFVLRESYQQSIAAALSRMTATLVSFALCLAYLAFLPFHPWALALLVGVSALAVTLLGRPGDAVTAAITTAVIMVVAAISPQHAWQQPVLRLADTVIGVAVGALAAWADLRGRTVARASQHFDGKSARAAPKELPMTATIRAPVSPYLRSECAIIAGMARASLPGSGTPWQWYAGDCDPIRDTMAHDQFNTTIYSNDDRYRGLKGLRTVIFINEADMRDRGLGEFDLVDVTSVSRDGSRRSVHGYRADYSTQSGQPVTKHLVVEVTPSGR